MDVIAAAAAAAAVVVVAVAAAPDAAAGLLVATHACAALTTATAAAAVAGLHRSRPPPAASCHLLGDTRAAAGLRVWRSTVAPNGPAPRLDVPPQRAARSVLGRCDHLRSRRTPLLCSPQRCDCCGGVDDCGGDGAGAAWAAVVPAENYQTAFDPRTVAAAVVAAAAVMGRAAWRDASSSSTAAAVVVARVDGGAVAAA